ncbi:hypothetical protein [Lederbergia citrea]|uniref:Uncharacterized protein n=1 Tax=Lederbergia citrea TaxID=2833581 RepID=A0A942ULF1_9BACI|nr:hypothetical protein [Lederbergia citrea]MBS4176861.1 hypothetical protein [Lederbergia citrea]MBS4203424.1 hypothetical protein [Lederbergia citrea]MBS4221902.1 hypothetical protein [Lederbergia citrea]
MRKMKKNDVDALSKFAAWCCLESYQIIVDEKVLDDILENSDEKYIKTLLLKGLKSKKKLLY